MASQYNACPNCGGRKRSKNKLCASCRGYGAKRHVTPDGYIRIWCPEHPMANSDGYALEHRKMLHDAGITIPPGSHVHHINGIKADNRVENLRVVSPGEHIDQHIPVGSPVVNQFGIFLRKMPASNIGRPKYKWRKTAGGMEAAA